MKNGDIVFGLVVLLCVILTCMIFGKGCTPEITDGIIITKIYEPATEEMSLLPIAVPSGKSTSIMLIPYMIYDDEDYIIEIQKVMDNRNVPVSRRLYITKEEFDSVNIGDTFVVKPFTMYNDKHRSEKVNNTTEGP